MKELPFDKVLFNPARIMIVSELKKRGLGIPFQNMKKKLDLTDGNLSSHLRVLKKHDLVKINKYFKGNYPETLIVLSVKGHRHWELLRKWVILLGNGK